MIDDLQPQKARAALAGDYYMLSLDIPSVLVECGFLSNAKEAELLCDEEYQEKIAFAIHLGILEYINTVENTEE